MWRVVWRPEWLRAPVRFFLVVRDSSGPPLCRCERSILTTKRVPGEVGFILMSAMAYGSLFRCRAGEVDGLSGLQTHVGFFEAIALARHILEAPRLAGAIQQIDALDIDLEHEFDGTFAFDFRCVVADAEYALIGLFGNV